MRLIIAAIGKLKAGPETTLAADYLARCAAQGRGLGFTGAALIELAAKPMGDRAREADALLRAAPKGALRVLLDERGENPSSADIAARLAHWRDGGAAAAVFWIGGADGADPALRETADETWAFGRATWPHRLARVMICEQLYRAVSILSGSPYHRE